MRTVYLLSEGEYSNYHIEAVFAVKAEAEAARARGLGDAVESVPFYEVGEIPRHGTRYYLSCWLGDAGDYYTSQPSFFWSKHLRIDTRLERVAEWHGVNLGDLRPKVDEHPNGPGVYLMISGLDREGVIKAFRDRFARWQVETNSARTQPDVEWVEGDEFTVEVDPTDLATGVFTVSAGWTDNPTFLTKGELGPIPSGADYPWAGTCRENQPHTIEEAMTVACQSGLWDDPIPLRISWWLSDITEATCVIEPEYRLGIPAGSTITEVERVPSGWLISVTTPPEEP